MTTSSIREYAGPGPTSDQPPVPEPSAGSLSATVGTAGRGKDNLIKLRPSLRRSVVLDDATTASLGSSRST
jgi:hypothetical protein